MWGESEKERKSIGVVQAKLNFYRCAACANQPEQTTAGPLALSLIRVKLRAEELSRKAAAFIYICSRLFFPTSSVTRCSARRERERARRECVPLLKSHRVEKAARVKIGATFSASPRARNSCLKNLHKGLCKFTLCCIHARSAFSWHAPPGVKFFITGAICQDTLKVS